EAQSTRSDSSAAQKIGSKSSVWKISGLALAVVAVVLVVYWRYGHQRTVTPPVSDRIMVSDFVNTTGDPVFNDALQQALTVSCRQSPFLSLVSADEVQQTLGYMKRSPDTPLSHDVALEVCQRTRSKAMLNGAISQLGSQYVLSLELTDCSTGAST